MSEKVAVAVMTVSIFCYVTYYPLLTDDAC